MKTYTFTLTRSERRAIDRVGQRYANGNELYRLLWMDSTPSPAFQDWISPREIAFTLDAPAAWRLAEIRDKENGRWPCFAAELARKLDDLCHAYEADHPSLDGMDPDDLEAYAADEANPEQLRQYAHLKALAMRDRERGDIDAALRRERRLEGLYQGLPAYMRW
jgi:hypothetical protein